MALHRKVDLFGAVIRKLSSSLEEEGAVAIESVDSTDRCFSVTLSHYDKVLFETAICDSSPRSIAGTPRIFGC